MAKDNKNESNSTEIDPPAPATADPAAPTAARAAELRVANGLSVNTLRGILTREDGPVSAKDFVHGDKDVADLVSRGALVRT